MRPLVISADNHANEPSHVCERVPAAMRDRAPKLMKRADGGDGRSADDPHRVAPRPDSHQQIPKLTQGLSAGDKHAVLCGDAARVYGFES